MTTGTKCLHKNKAKMSLIKKFKVFKRSSFFKYGIPFLLLMVGGSFGLQEFTKLRYQFSQQKITPEKMEQFGVKMKKPGEVTLETEYEKVKNLNIDDWDNKRGPRPWEEHY